MDSLHSGFEFESYKCHTKNAIGEEGNGKSPHKIHVSRKNSGLASGFYYAVYNAVYIYCILYTFSFGTLSFMFINRQLIVHL